MINSRIEPSILFLLQTQNTVMQQYSFYIMPVAQYNPTIFAFNAGFTAANAAHATNDQTFMASLYTNYQPLP